MDQINSYGDSEAEDSNPATMDTSTAMQRSSSTNGPADQATLSPASAHSENESESRKQFIERKYSSSTSVSSSHKVDANTFPKISSVGKNSSSPLSVNTPLAPASVIYNNNNNNNNNNNQQIGPANVKAQTSQQACTAFIASCEFIPMRLTQDERLLLDVLEHALDVCEYTDVVDVTFSYTKRNKSTRIYESLVDILTIACGLVTAHSLTKGEKLVVDRSLNDNVPLFRDLFEVGRRYKIMNPSKMRDTYGKLMYMLMDAESPLIKSELKIDFVKPILTVHSFLKERKGLSLLTDPMIFEALHISTDSDNALTTTTTNGNSVHSAMSKKSIMEILVKRYQTEWLSDTDITRVIDSLRDNEAYRAFNVDPVERMIRILKKNFNADVPCQEMMQYSLDLRSRIRGSFSSSFSALGGFSSKYFGGGAKLSHDHKTQFNFVLQSLTLWREIMSNMPKLWMLADFDMLIEMYRLVDTGQGYQRLQSCPRVGGEMRRILSVAKDEIGGAGNWVGLSVVHLGDRDVPNALVFIDKYTQVPRILKPIVQCIEKLPSLVDDKAFHAYVNAEWASLKGLKLQILSDFFKHGFDGSGDDGGSCIDGRLTSAWNWCSKLHKKPYYHVFMFTGFQGFDGDWKEE